MGEGQPERRQYPRAIVGCWTKGRVTDMYEVSLLNISLAGAMLEHVDTLRPGTILFLSFDLQGERANANFRVVWSEVHGTAIQPDGEQALIYHTGVEFPNPSEETRQVISDYLQSNTGNGTGSSAGEEELREHLLRELEELDGLVSGARRVLEEGTPPSNGEV